MYSSRLTIPVHFTPGIFPVLLDCQSTISQLLNKPIVLIFWDQGHLAASVDNGVKSFVIRVIGAYRKCYSILRYDCISKGQGIAGSSIMLMGFPGEFWILSGDSSYDFNVGVHGQQRNRAEINPIAHGRPVS